MTKYIKLGVEILLFIVFIAVIVGFFVNLGVWMGILGGLLFFLFALNIILGKILKQGKLGVSKGGWAVLIFLLVFGIFFVYLAVVLGERNLVADSNYVVIKKTNECQSKKCEINLIIPDKKLSKSNALGFLETRVRPNNFSEKPVDIFIKIVGPGINLEQKLDNLLRPQKNRRTTSSLSMPQRSGGGITLANYYSQILDDFYLKAGEYKITFFLNDEKNFIENIDYLRVLIYEKE